MIQIHGKTILLMEFKSMIKAHDLNPWQFIYPKPNFSLATSKPNSHWQYQSLVLKHSSHWQYLKPNSHWQYQSPVLTGNI